ncbi:hypothetical protein [Burkholderia cenocepacia]|uniref:hypothetical protein n=1 Tax=Burkholderia cenocepacia TaxID=95486 RepID=UPI000F5A526A|nr:hypothetical protein [Burkholderia cenocepacia]
MECKIVCRIVKRLAVFGIFSFVVSGCVPSPEVLANICVPSEAYNRGMNDAMSEELLDQRFIGICPGNVKLTMQDAYRDGYMKGQEVRQKQRDSDNAAHGMDVNIYHFGRRKRFYCEMHVFARGYSAYGETELQAREGVQAKCESKLSGGPMFCTSEHIECKFIQ